MCWNQRAIAAKSKRAAPESGPLTVIRETETNRLLPPVPRSQSNHAKAGAEEEEGGGFGDGSRRKYCTFLTEPLSSHVTDSNPGESRGRVPRFEQVRSVSVRPDLLWTGGTPCRGHR